MDPGPGPRRPLAAAPAGPPCAPGEGNPAILTLHGREQVEELELAQARGEGSVDARIEATGLDFRISTRCTSWVAVSEERTVDPGKPGRRVKVPQALPEGMGIDGLGLRAPAPQFAGAGMPPGAPMPMMVSADASAPAPSARASRILDRVFVARSEAKEKKAEASRSTPGPLAGRVSSLYGHTGLLLRGRLVFRKGDRVVFEIELDQDLRWDPGQELTLRMNEGGTQPLRLDATASTAPGNLRAGQTLRLVCTGLSLARAVGKGDGLSLLNDGQAVVVLL